jgi:hypothetical protein
VSWCCVLHNGGFIGYEDGELIHIFTAYSNVEISLVFLQTRRLCHMKMLLLFEIIRTFGRRQYRKTFRCNCIFIFTYETVCGLG